jgi:hypothetical protein
MDVNSRDRKMSQTVREYAANYRKPPVHIRFKKGQSGDPRSRPVKKPGCLAGRGGVPNGYC